MTPYPLFRTITDNGPAKRQFVNAILRAIETCSGRSFNSDRAVFKPKFVIFKAIPSATVPRVANRHLRKRSRPSPRCVDGTPFVGGFQEEMTLGKQVFGDNSQDAGQGCGIRIWLVNAGKGKKHQSCDQTNWQNEKGPVQRTGPNSGSIQSGD